MPASCQYGSGKCGNPDFPRTLERTIGGLLDGCLDFIVSGGLVEHASKIDNRDIGGGNTHGHAGELAVEGWDDLSDSLGGTSAAGNDVGSRRTATSPVLARGSVDRLLGGGIRVNGGHEALLHAELVVNDLGQGSQAVGGAGGVGDDGDVGLVRFIVDAHDKHGSIGRGRRDDDLLGTTLQVGRGLLCGCEDTGRLNNVVCAGVGPWDLGRISLHVELDFLAVDDQGIFLDLNGAVEFSVCAVVLEHVCLLSVNDGSE